MLGQGGFHGSSHWIQSKIALNVDGSDCELVGKSKKIFLSAAPAVG
jgi:hypothetical protein